MKRIVALFCLIFACGCMRAQVAVGDGLWGAHYNRQSSVYPPPAPLQFTWVRLWDTGTGWADMQNTAECSHTRTAGCDFAPLKAWLTKFRNPQPKIILTLFKTPNFIATNPFDPNCAYTAQLGAPNGSCTPPKDLGCDGTGTNATFINYLNALWDFILANGFQGRITAVEIGNEWNVPAFFDLPYVNGTLCASTPNAAEKMLVRMEQDARCVLKGTDCSPYGNYPESGMEPEVMILSSPLPSPGGNNHDIMAGGLEDTYFAEGGGKYADMLSIHGYLMNKNQSRPACSAAGANAGCAWPENLATMIPQLRSLAASYHLTQPWIISEASWGANSGLADEQYKMAFVGRYLALLGQYGISDFVWYNVDGSPKATALFRDSRTGAPDAAGVAWGTMQSWLAGKTFTNNAPKVTAQPSCSGGSTSHIYEEALTTGEMLVWYDELADDASCPYSTAGYSSYKTLDGGSTPISGPIVMLDNRPLLLQPMVMPPGGMSATIR